MEVIEFRPEREQYAFTFGGVAPVRKIHPGTALKLWTDAASGRRLLTANK